MSFLDDRKYDRLHKLTEDTELSERNYNLALGGTVLYGLIVNIIMCKLLGNSLVDVNPWLFIIGYFVLAITGIMMSTKSNSPIISFLGYNLVVVPIGLLLSIVISEYVEGGNADLIFQAIIYTSIITGVMITLSIIYPKFFAKLGGLLFGALVGLIIAELLTLFVFSWAQNLLTWVGVIIFSLYIGYDYYKAQEYPKTLDNAIDSAVDLYLDIINLFLRILEILGNSKSSSSRRK